MTVNQAFYPVGTMARVLGVSRSGFYAWRVRSPNHPSWLPDRLPMAI